MKSGWKECTIGDIASVKGGKRLPKGVNLITERNSHPYIRIRDLTEKTLELKSSYEYVDDNTQKSISRYIVDTGDILISIVGTIGLIAVVGDTLKGANLTENCVKLIDIKENVDKEYLYYFLVSSMGQDEIKKGMVGAVQLKLPIKNIQSIKLLLPPIEIQQQISGLLAALDRKIAQNTAINENLEEQAQAIFKAWFTDFKNYKHIICRADEFFDISIGKTPPRKEKEWFSTDNSDVKWVSISDMGNCGMYVNNSSEYLTQQAIKKFNIKIVPENTVLLSFKLTVGRVAITNDNMATNEAIAHFKTDKEYIIEYLYFYLKNFNFQSLGSTSSIATAVNSKIIKGMPFVVPAIDEITRFHEIASSLFAEIKKNQEENRCLSAIRDTLLPKLMNGEIDVSEIKI